MGESRGYGDGDERHFFFKQERIERSQGLRKRRK